MRHKATTKWLFVLRRNPGRLEAYQLPTLAPVQWVRAVSLREPADSAIHEDGNENTAYILDNAHDSDRFRSLDESTIGAQVLRVSLTHHTSARRDVLITRATDRFAIRVLSGEEWRTLESIDLVDNDIRIVVRENERRFVEYFTLDGLQLERQRLVSSR